MPDSVEGSGFTIVEVVDSLPDRVARLAAMSALEYDQCRKAEAERLGVRLPALDAEVKKARRDGAGGKPLQGRSLELANPPLWPDAVLGADLLHDMTRFFERYLALPAGGSILLALWAVHTHCYDSFRHTPRLAVRSPEKGCGKTTVLDLLELVCARPLPTASVTPAAMFRAVEAAKPTLLIDEADTFLANSDELRGILNVGNKKGGQVIRCVGDDAEPRAFAAFAPAAIAAIGHLPGTIQDRSVTLLMRRAMGKERPAGITVTTEAEGRALASRAARWVSDNQGALAETVPRMPPGVINRKADNWRPLIAIAGLAGGTWADEAARLAAAPAGDDDGQGLLSMLLADLQAIFKETGIERLATAELVKRLLDRDDRPWPELPGTGKPITAAKLTQRLNPVGVHRQQWRVPGTDDRVWGFYRADLADATARYVGDTTSNGGDVVTTEAASAANQNPTGDSDSLSPPKTGDTIQPSLVERPVSPWKNGIVTTSPANPRGEDKRWVAEL
jgi:hypothetical protein